VTAVLVSGLGCPAWLINNSDRVVGALIVFYAQPLTRVVQLTTDVRTDDNGVVTVTLGPVVLEIPERFARVAPHYIGG
jgi:hypothetical protein